MTDSEKLDLLLQKSTVLESDVGALKEDMQEMKESQASLRQDMEEMKESQASLRQDMEEMKESQTSLRQDMEEMKESQTSLRQDIAEMKIDISSLREEVHLTLENEVRPNINVIAEGHLELTRKLNECIYLCSDIKAKQEILDVFINLQKSNNRLKAL